jgi:ribonuclease BN (tRNA processing enzyme)
MPKGIMLRYEKANLQMKLTFIGTRGEIEMRTRRHRVHTSLLVSFRRANVMIDAGLDWLGKLKRVSPSAMCLHTRIPITRGD